MANMTLKMLGFLVLNQDFLIIKLTIAIPTPRFTLLLLFTSHIFTGGMEYKHEIMKKIRNFQFSLRF